MHRLAALGLTALLLSPLVAAGLPPTGIEDVDNLRRETGILPIEGGPTGAAYAQVVPAGDVDGDGEDDALAVAHAFAIEGGLNRARVDAFGAGGLLWSRDYGAGVYASAFPLGDVTGDGRADIGVQLARNTETLLGGFTCIGLEVTGACAMWSGRAETIAIELLDGADGHARWSYEFPAATGVLTLMAEGWGIVAGGYVHGFAWPPLVAVDGPAPLVVWVSDSYVGPESVGGRVSALIAIEPLTGTPVWTREFAATPGSVPYVLVVPDATGDGQEDVLVETRGPEDLSDVQLLSGADGLTTWSDVTPRAQSWQVAPGGLLLAERGPRVEAVWANNGTVHGGVARTKWLPPTLLPDGTDTKVVVADPRDGGLLLRAYDFPSFQGAWVTTLWTNESNDPDWEITRLGDGPTARLLVHARGSFDDEIATKRWVLDGHIGAHDPAGLTPGTTWPIRATGDIDLGGSADAYALQNAWPTASVVLVRGEDGASAWTREIEQGTAFTQLGDRRLVLHTEAAWADPKQPLALAILDGATGATHATLTLPPLE